MQGIRRLSEAAQAVAVSAHCQSPSVGLGLAPDPTPRLTPTPLSRCSAGCGDRGDAGLGSWCWSHTSWTHGHQKQELLHHAVPVPQLFFPKWAFLPPLWSRIRAKPLVSSGGTRHPSSSWAHQSLAVPLQQQLPSPGAMLVPPQEDHRGMEPSLVARAGPWW